MNESNPTYLESHTLGRARAYFELMRFPAAFTAVADIAMGYLVTRGALHPPQLFAVLAIVSALLYLAGMVLNDAFDAEFDARERPRRPIPSGRISRRRAAVLGTSLLIAGVLLALHISDHSDAPRIAVIAVVLAACIVSYDAFLKRTVAGPVAMGCCRLLNVLLGMGLAAQASDPSVIRPWTPTEWAIAAGICIYVTGVTLLARNESRTSARATLIVGTAVLFAGIVLIASVPAWSVSGPLAIVTRGWYLLWAVLMLVIARRCVLAVMQPRPEFVQAAVRHCLRSIIVIDAAIVLGFCGVYWGCAVLLLLAPMTVTELWISTT